MDSPDRRNSRPLLESHPNFPRANVEIFEGLEQAKIAERMWLTAVASKERMEVVLTTFDIRARAYLQMVDDLELLRSYADALSQCARTAWIELTGSLIDAADLRNPGVQDRWGMIESRIRYWQKEGFKRLLPEQEVAPSVSTSDLEENIEPGETDEVTRRGRLLSEYKKGTKDPSNRQIYTAKNSGIHKPQFYKWLHGILPTTSATAVNFERFLREKKRPIPRSPEDQ